MTGREHDTDHHNYHELPGKRPLPDFLSSLWIEDELMSLLGQRQDNPRQEAAWLAEDVAERMTGSKRVTALLGGTLCYVWGVHAPSLNDPSRPGTSFILIYGGVVH